MYEKHPSFDLPSSDSKIWRYMDLSKFLSLLEEQCLFFARTDSFDDPYEYAVPHQSQTAWNNMWEEESNASLGSIDESELEKIDRLEARVKSNKDSLPKMMEFLRKTMFASCWHINQYESNAMWKLYLKSGEGIAIQTTVGRLVESVSLHPEHIFIGKVKYINYKSDSISIDNSLNFAIHKRLDFEYEHELRALIWKTQQEKGENFSGEREMQYPIEKGISVPVNVNQLIETIYVAPSNPDWFWVLIDKIKTRYGLNADVVRSEIDRIS
jgi:hypothetical protein